MKPFSPSALAPWLALAAATGCSSLDPITACDPIGEATPLCGFHNPEDLALLPDGRHVLVSEYAGMEDDGSGSLALLDLATRERRVLFAGGEPGAPAPWGDPGCEGPPARISPHGIDLARRRDAALQLLVVQHAERESVEMFEVVQGSAGWGLVWRGCAVPAEGHGLNDVVALPEGGFLVTHMVAPDAGVLRMAGAALLGLDTGYVLAWQREQGFTELPGTRGALPNGIEVSADGAKIYLNQTLASEVTRIDRASGSVEARAEIPHPDNLTWTSDGRLLVASLRGSTRALLACGEIASGSCPSPFAIVALDPDTLESEVVYEGGAGTPSGAGTVGLEVPGGLLVGTFAGDRIVWVERDE